MHSWSFQIFFLFLFHVFGLSSPQTEKKTLSQEINTCNYIPILTRVYARAKSEISDSLSWGLLEHSSLSCRSLSMYVYTHTDFTDMESHP